MSVVSVKEQHQHRRSGWREGRETHVRVFLVTTDDPRDGTRVALIADDGIQRIPSPREGLDGSTTILVSSIDAEPVNNSDRHFEVTVEYTTSDPNDTDRGDVHPLDREPEISWGSEDAVEPYFIDTDSTPVVNSAGDAFDQFTTRESGTTTITLIRNEQYHDATQAEAFRHTTNAEFIVLHDNVYAPGTLKLSPITASRVVEVVNLNGYDEEVTYYRRTYTFKYRKEGWNDHLLDVGTNEAFDAIVKVNGIDTPVKKVRPIVDSTGNPVKKPWPLDGAGKKKPSATDEPATNVRKPYAMVSWAPLYL